MSPRVTWLLPVLNGMPYLLETLASLFGQTYRDFDVLAWDNGSTDGSAELLAEWIPLRLPGRVITDRPISGLGACLRAMVAEAGGELIARIDADDNALPERLARQVTALDAHPDWLGVGSQMVIIDARGRRTSVDSSLPCQPEAIRWQAFFSSPIAHPSVCLRRDAVLASGNYTDIGVGQDWDLWIRMLLNGPLGNLPEPLIERRRHAASISTSKRSLWPELGRRLAERHAEALFPGVPVGEALTVWRFLSPRSSDPRAAPPAPQLVYRMALAAERDAGLPLHAIAGLPHVMQQMRACVKRDPVRLIAWIGLLIRLRLTEWRPRRERIVPRSPADPGRHRAAHSATR